MSEEKKLNGTVIVTYRCNARCSMCNRYKAPSKPEEEISIETIKKLPKMYFTNITGGEPFIRTDLKDIVRELYKKSDRIVISTNGFFTDRIVDLCKEFPQIGIRISIEGLEQTNNEIRGLQNGYQRGYGTLKKLREMGMKDVGFGMTVQDKNAPDLVPLYKISDEMGMEFATASLHNSFYFVEAKNIIHDRPMVAKNFENLVNELLRSNSPKKWFRAYFNHGLINYIYGQKRLLPCDMSFDTFFIDPYGDVMPCNGTKDKEVMKTTLLIMAAGIGSRFGTGIKQLEPVDDAGHIIMDYSIHDAIEAGFNHVVFIIRKDIEKEFKEVIGDRIASICSSHNVTVDYAFQDINDIPGTLPEGRTKPWGTGQAVLAAKKVIKTPFIVINADDYYGKEGFKAVHEYLVNGGKSCMAGFVLKNTMSDNGGVTRGICKMDDQNNLTEVVETKNIVKTADGAETDGVVVDVNSLVSMNMWGLTPEFLDVLEEGFKEFFEKEVPSNPQKAEYLIPIFIGELLEQGKMSVKVLKTNDTWYGMTYHEDVAAVKGSFKEMLENGVYKADLFSDL